MPLLQYYASNDKTAVSRQLAVTMDTRYRAVKYLIRLNPRIALQKVLSGWIGKDFNQGAYLSGSTRIEESALEPLKVSCLTELCYSSSRLYFLALIRVFSLC